MATIQNQQVIQKLIDELELYPALDKMPTELADKILPVFQVNSDSMEMVPEGDLKYIRDETLNSNDKSMTVPSGKKWQVQFGFVSWTTTATVGTRYPQIKVKDADGNVIWWLQMDTITASSTESHNLLTGYETKGGTAPTLTVGIPDKCMLLEDWSIQIVDNDDVDGNDDFTMALLVRESDFVNKF